jgi:2',3'-cyclic-nucleotide 2'-phosphodiesterase (5'-nucleotidase family)
VIQSKRQQDDDLLLVDTGDFVRGKGSANILRAQYLAKAMSRMGYDAVNLGREEVVLGTDEILRLRDLERLPLVSSNVMRRQQGRHLVLPYIVERVGGSAFLGFRYGGVRVALIGLTLSGESDPMRRMIPSDLEVEPAAEILQTTLKKLRGHCDVVVVLSDLDLLTAQQLSHQVEGIDLFFIGAGARSKFFDEIEGTIFVYPAKNGEELGDVKLLLNDQKGVENFSVEWTLLDTSYADAPEMAQLIESYKEERKKLQQKPPQLQK